MPTLLLTGFGPFPGVHENPSERLANEFARGAELPGVKITTGILPTHWQKTGPALAALFARFKPDFCIHLGYSAASPGFCLEDTAHNQTCAQPDIGGSRGTGQAILDGLPLQLTSSAPLERITRHLSAAGFNNAVSSDPGRYLCNMSYYLSLVRSRSSLFIHIPAIETGAGLIPKEHQGDHHLILSEAMSGLRMIIEVFNKTLTRPAQF